MDRQPARVSTNRKYFCLKFGEPGVQLDVRVRSRRMYHLAPEEHHNKGVEYDGSKEGTCQKRVARVVF